MDGPRPPVQIWARIVDRPATDTNSPTRSGEKISAPVVSPRLLPEVLFAGVVLHISRDNTVGHSPRVGKHQIDVSSCGEEWR